VTAPCPLGAGGAVSGSGAWSRFTPVAGSRGRMVRDEGVPAPAETGVCHGQEDQWPAPRRAGSDAAERILRPAGV
jgi:hypothetical protein